MLFILWRSSCEILPKSLWCVFQNLWVVNYPRCSTKFLFITEFLRKANVWIETHNSWQYSRQQVLSDVLVHLLKHRVGATSLYGLRWKLLKVPFSNICKGLQKNMLHQTCNSLRYGKDKRWVLNGWMIFANTLNIEWIA